MYAADIKSRQNFQDKNLLAGYPLKYMVAIELLYAPKENVLIKKSPKTLDRIGSNLRLANHIQLITK